MAEKKLPDAIEVKRMMLEHDHLEISVRPQCELIGLNRSTAYHQPAGESEYNLHLANYGFATFQQPLLLLRR